MFIAAITASELLHGVERAADPVFRTKRAAFVEALLSRFQVLEFDIDVARYHARIWASLATGRTMIGPHDLQIAATALRHEFRLATLNRDKFLRVPSLRLTDLQEYVITV